MVLSLVQKNKGKHFCSVVFLAEHLRNASSRMPNIRAGTSFSENIQLMVGQYHCCMPNDAWQPRLRDFQVMLAPGTAVLRGGAGSAMMS